MIGTLAFLFKPSFERAKILMTDFNLILGMLHLVNFQKGLFVGKPNLTEPNQDAKRPKSNGLRARLLHRQPGLIPAVGKSNAKYSVFCPSWHKVVGKWCKTQ